MKRYLVKMDVFFVVYHEVEANDEEQAFEKARGLVHYGEGEEVKLFEIEEL